LFNELVVKFKTAVTNDITRKDKSDAWEMESPLDWGFFSSSLVSVCRERLLRDPAALPIYVPKKYERDAWKKIIEVGGNKEKDFLEKLSPFCDLPSNRGNANTQVPEQTPESPDPSTKTPGQINQLPTQPNAGYRVIPQATGVIDPSLSISKASLPRAGANDAEVLVPYKPL
jgi:hypothetical protein